MALLVSGAGSADTSGTITGYVWSWGDGTADTSLSSPTASHTYTTTGTFTITLTVADNLPAIHSATTSATIATPLPPPPGTPTSPSPADGSTGVSATPTLTWSAPGATSYDVRFGATTPPPLVASAATSAAYSPASLTAGTTYYWQIVAHNSGGATPGPVWSFTTAVPPPAAPGAPTPANGATSVSSTPTLTWTAAGATSYDVNFGSTNPPPSVAAAQPSASYTPATLTAATPYYWQIVAHNSGGATMGPVWSFTIATSSGSLPAPWQTQDIGAVGVTGSAQYAAGQFTVQGAGDDIWGSADAFRYVYQPFAGDGYIVARVTQEQNTNPYAKAGVMVRDTLKNGSAHVILDVTPGGGVEFMQRVTTDGPTSYLGGTTAALPAWLRLTRNGSAVTAAVSSDGTVWTTIGTTPVSTTGSGFIGLPVTSHTSATLATMTFDQVAAVSSPPAAPPAAPGAPTPPDGATGVSGAPTLIWTAVGATSYDVSFGLTNPPPSVATAQPSASYTPAALNANTSYYWQIVAHNSAGATPGPVWSFTTAGSSSPDVVIYASDVPSTALHGMWSRAADPTSPNGIKLATPDNGWSLTAAPNAAPADYFDVTFNAAAGTPYTVWFRLQALANSKWNDSIWVQFSDALANGAPVYPIGTTTGLLVKLATDATASSDQGWGWQNTAYWLAQPTTVTFATNGTHTLRIQVREDGVEVDQIVLSPSTYLQTAPGAVSNDTTIVPVVTSPPATPPAVPGAPTPPDGAGGVNGTPTLTWTAAGATSYDVSFGLTNPPPSVATAQLAASYAPAALNADSSYYWQIVAHNSAGTTPGRVWSFTTAPAVPVPATPSAPTPPNGATGVSGTPTLAWTAAGATSYDVSFGLTNPPPSVATAQPNASYAPAPLSGNLSYYWQIVAHNSAGTTRGPVWSFTTAMAVPVPAAPSAPTPPNGATGVSGTPTLTWTAAGATSYDVNFGLTNPPPPVAAAQPNASYTPASLSGNMSYFWQIVAHNSSGATTGPVWSFTTAGPSSGDVVIYAGDVPATALHGMWSQATDPTSPNGIKLATPDNGWSLTSAPNAAPADYFDITFNATAGTPYTIWFRLQALANSKWNDSIWVQFSDALANGAPVYPIGTPTGLLVNLATDATASSDQMWGWQNTAYWLAQPTTVTFATNGTHTLRIQVREDGVEVDQIVLSPSTYLHAAPGAVSNDSTIVPRQ